MSAYSPEPWITRQELADQLHVSLRHVDHLVSAGAPSVVFGVDTRRFLASRVAAWQASKIETTAGSRAA